MRLTWIPIWKRAPFLRLLLPLILGISLQFYFQFEFLQIIFAEFSFVVAVILFQFLPFSLRFKLQALLGHLINLVIIVLGLLLTYHNDIRHQQNWFGNFYNEGD